MECPYTETLSVFSIILNFVLNAPFYHLVPPMQLDLKIKMSFWKY